MTLSHQRPLAVVFAATLTVALWSPTLSGPLQQSATVSSYRPDAPLAARSVFGAAHASPVLM